MKSSNPLMGRPKKQPSAKALEQLGPNRLLFEDVKNILIKCRVRGRWTYVDVLLLIDWFISPEAFDVIKTEVIEAKPFKITYTLPLISFTKNAEVTGEHVKISKALHLAKLLSQSPDELIQALPKIHKRILNYFTDSPTSRPLESLMMEQAIGSSLKLKTAGDF